MGQDFIPDSDVDFDVFLSQFTGAIAADPGGFGLTAQDVAAVQAPAAAWGKALSDHQAAQLAARGAVQVKDKARGEAVAIVRSTVKKINGNPEVDNALRAKAALPAHEVRAAIGVPATRPIGRIEPSASRTLIVHFVDEMTPQRTAKPYGVHGCQIWSFVGENPPADGSGFAFLALDTRTPYTDVHADIDAGKTVHYRLRWANTKGEPGPWSAVVAAKIPL